MITGDALVIKKIFIALCVILCIIIFSSIAYAEAYADYVNDPDIADVVISVLNNTPQSTSIFDVQVEVIFNNPDAIDMFSKLSYHLFSEDGTNILVYDFERINVVPTYRHIYTMLINKPESIDNGLYKFDLVQEDHEPTYWYSGKYKVYSDTIEYRYDAAIGEKTG